MTPTERMGPTRVELCGRETLPAPASARRERLSDVLAALEASGTVDEFVASSWPKRVPRDGAACRDARDRYLAFARWARERGVRLTPSFGTRECYSVETGDRGDWIVFPVLCLAVYEGDELVAVYPHTDGETHRSVGDGIAALSEPGDSPAKPVEPVPGGLAD
ncbi:MAG: HTH domain-containing protein [Haloarculaceae archaeon]